MFVTLTTMAGSAVLINLDLVQHIYPMKDGAQVSFGGKEYIDVRESPEDILNKAGIPIR